VNHTPTPGGSLRTRQRGMATMIMAIVLLGILTVMALFSLSIGVFEQRTATNDNRARLVHAAAEAGLNQGIEFFKRNKQVAIEDWLYPTGSATIRWVLCTSSETSFPCGAETDTARRATLFRYTDTNNALINPTDGAARTDVSGTTDVDERRVLNFGASMPSSAEQAVTTTGYNGNFSVDYDVGALLCLIDEDNPTTCITTLDSDDQFRGRYAVTLVSKARLADETTATGTDSERASATHKVTVALFPAINGIPNAPVIASGSVTGLGSFEIVPNENAGGTTERNGVPISIWSNQDANYSDQNGAAQSCHLGEWYSNANTGGPANTYCSSNSNTTTATGSPTTCGSITVCTRCKCDGLKPDRGLLSGKCVGGGGNACDATSNRFEGIDVLDIDATGQTATTAVSALPNPTCNGTHFFFPRHPCDLASYSLDDSLFEYVFGIENSAESDSALIDANSNGLDDGADYMNNSSSFTKISTSADCGLLTYQASGFYYIKPGVDCSANAQVGTPGHPVGVVTDGTFRMQGGNAFFGLIFSRRYLSSGATVNAQVHIAASSVIFGSVVAEGDVQVNGSTQVVYNQTVLQNLANNPASGGIANITGSWSDDVTLN